MSVMLEARGLSKLYHHETTPVLALDSVDLSVDRGEFIAITGPSGAGKSTLLNVIAGLDQPDQGSVMIDGVSIYDISETKRSRFRNQRIGYIFQAFNLLAGMTVLENCRLPHHIAGSRPDASFEKDVLSQLGLDQRLNFFPDQLSGGEQQRVAIARAILMNPAIIIADEPTGNLDSANSDQFIDLIREMHVRFEQTVIMVTHNLELAGQTDRIIALQDGRILADQQKDLSL